MEVQVKRPARLCRRSRSEWRRLARPSGWDATETVFSELFAAIAARLAPPLASLAACSPTIRSKPAEDHPVSASEIHVVGWRFPSFPPRNYARFTRRARSSGTDYAGDPAQQAFSLISNFTTKYFTSIYSFIATLLNNNQNTS